MNVEQPWQRPPGTSQLMWKQLRDTTSKESPSEPWNAQEKSCLPSWSEGRDLALRTSPMERSCKAELLLENSGWMEEGWMMDG